VNARVAAQVGAAVGALCFAVVVQARHGATLAGDPLPLPQRLSETGLYLPDRPSIVDPRNHGFAPQYPLWSDGLTKRRWVRIPPGNAVDARDDYAWDFPTGTRFWKEFSRGNRKVETRLLWKASSAGWVFASYAWNADGTDAVLVPDEGALTDVEVAPGRRHAIPSRTDCAACHGSSRAARPLGFNLLQLSPDRDPNALHAEPVAHRMLTLPRAVREGLIAGLSSRWLQTPPRIRTNNATTRTALGYLAANCSMCHNGNGEITAAAPVIRSRDLLEDGDAVAMSLPGQPTRWQLPGSPDGSTVLVQAGSPERSAMLARMRSRAPSTQMPPLGTVVRDQAAVELMERWIIQLRRSH
jgi:cytochrome c553